MIDMNPPRYACQPAAFPGLSRGGKSFGRVISRSVSHGLSFVEIVVALFVLVVALVPVFRVFSQGTMGTMMTHDEVLAHQYAGEMLAWAQARGFDGLDVDEFRHPKVMPEVEGSSPIDSRFRRTFSVLLKQPVGGLSDWPMEYKILKTEIHWESSGVDQAFVLTGLVFKGRMP